MYGPGNCVFSFMFCLHAPLLKTFISRKVILKNNAFYLCKNTTIPYECIERFGCTTDLLTTNSYSDLCEFHINSLVSCVSQFLSDVNCAIRITQSMLMN